MLRGSRDFERSMSGSSASSWSNATADGPCGSARTEQNCEVYRRVDAWHRRDVFSLWKHQYASNNTYSVPSRLIGERVDVHVNVECLEVRHGRATSPAPGAATNTTSISLRGEIDWLVRAGSVCRLLPSPCSRRAYMAYDVLLEKSPVARPRIICGFSS